MPVAQCSERVGDVLGYAVGVHHHTGDLAKPDGDRHRSRRSPTDQPNQSNQTQWPQGSGGSTSSSGPTGPGAEYRGERPWICARSSGWLQQLFRVCTQLSCNVSAVIDETQVAETAVRNYLLYQDDPTQLVDADQVLRLEQAAAAATDPIAKLKALAALTRARQLDIHRYEQDFIQHARAWAEDNDIPGSVFGELGVPESVLRSAGFGVGRRGKASTAQTLRAKSVSAKDIQDHIVRWRKQTFTLANVAQTVGGSPMTIRKAVDELVRSGTITRVGPTPDWSGPGRAPIQFSKS